jgi:hypothetical protein
MSDESDPFDVENLSLSPELTTQLGTAKAEAVKRNGANQPPELTAKLRAHRMRNSEPSRRVKREGLFVQIPVKALVAVSEVLGNKWALVWDYIHHRVGATGKNTVEIGNVGLREWGVDRFTKLRALRAFESAGLITVEWRVRRSPLVTVRRDLCMLDIRSGWQAGA